MGQFKACFCLNPTVSWPGAIISLNTNSTTWWTIVTLCVSLHSTFLKTIRQSSSHQRIQCIFMFKQQLVKRHPKVLILLITVGHWDISQSVSVHSSVSATSNCTSQFTTAVIVTSSSSIANVKITFRLNYKSSSDEDEKEESMSVLLKTSLIGKVQINVNFMCYNV